MSRRVAHYIYMSCETIGTDGMLLTGIFSSTRFSCRVLLFSRMARPAVISLGRPTRIAEALVQGMQLLTRRNVSEPQKWIPSRAVRIGRRR